MTTLPFIAALAGDGGWSIVVGCTGGHSAASQYICITIYFKCFICMMGMRSSCRNPDAPNHGRNPKQNFGFLLGVPVVERMHMMMVLRWNDFFLLVNILGQRY